MVLWCKRIHKSGRKFSGFSQIFMELCTCKVELASLHRNSINGLVQRKPKQREGESHFTLENSGEKKASPLDIWQTCATLLHFKYQGQKKQYSLTIEIPHDFFKHSRKFHFFFTWALEFFALSSVLLQIPCLRPPVWIFSEIIQWLC